MQYLKDYYDPTLESTNISIWELIYMMLLSPTEGFNYIKSHENNMALYILFIIGVICASISYIIFFATTGFISDQLWLLIPIIFFAGIIMLLATAVYHLIAELFAKRGNATDMVVIVSMSQLPNFFLIFLYGFGLIDTITTSIATLLYLGVMFWSFLITFRGIAILYEISNLKAIFIIALPALIIMGMLFIVIIAGFSYATMFMGDIINEIMSAPIQSIE